MVADMVARSGLGWTLHRLVRLGMCNAVGSVRIGFDLDLLDLLVLARQFGHRGPLVLYSSCRSWLIPRLGWC